MQPTVVTQISNKMNELKAQLDVAVLELELKIRGGQFSPAIQAKFAEVQQAISDGDYDRASALLTQVRDMMDQEQAGQ